jgi:probable rRNA maturation factor
VHVVEVLTETTRAGIDASALHQLAVRTLEAESVGPAELSVVLTVDAKIRELNRAYRGSDAATDVLSFSQGEGEAFARPEGVEPHIGDVVISLETARRQAAEYAVPLQNELAHLLVHGVLHLLGYDHESAGDAKIMRAREDAILGEAHHH